MKKLFICSLLLLSSFASAKAQSVSSIFVDEAAMKADMMQMLARFTEYVKADYQDIDPNYGCFRGENTMGSDEKGVRPNADLGMVCAFLCKYGRGQAQLPQGVTWQDLETMARKSLAFSVATHKAVHRRACSDGRYWGSVSQQDHTWESSLWAMSVAYSAFFQWDKLDETVRSDIYHLLKAECNYELERDIPTGYRGDTKAEENGWEADVLAATLALFPDDALATQWAGRLKVFAVNSYSHPSDTTSLYRGQNLYPDWTLQNHHFFHTSYQNVVIQELGEAVLALNLFQTKPSSVPSATPPPFHSFTLSPFSPLLHNCDKVTANVLNWLSLPDGEQAMPNGNDWSLFLYDQITSYSTMACMLRDSDALMLENQAYKQIKARQQTTCDGGWLLRPDVGARRMGVEAHRVMMTWLMHERFSTSNLRPSTWDDFLGRHLAARIFPCQNIIRAASRDRFTCFSWSAGKQSYTGYIAPFNLKNNNLIVPFRQNNTGNFLGWYTVEGCKTNAKPVVSGIYQTAGNSYVMNGELNVNDSALNHRFAIYSTTGNAVIYLDDVRANRDCRIIREQGGLMAISTDEFTRNKRDIITADTTFITDGSALSTFKAAWANIDNTFGIVCRNRKGMAFGDRADNNSVMTSRLYAAYDVVPRLVVAGHRVGCRQIVYYSNVTAAETDSLSTCAQSLDMLPRGWHGIIAADPDGTRYLLLSNFCSQDTVCTLRLSCKGMGAPVFSVPAMIDASTSTATFSAKINHSIASDVKVFIEGTGIRACLRNNQEVEVDNVSNCRQAIVVRTVGSHGVTINRYDMKKGEKLTLPSSN